MDVEYFKKRLEEEKIMLGEELARIGRKNPKSGSWETTPETLDTSVSEDDELADAIESFEERNATEHELEKRLKEVLHALKKVVNGTYGDCEISHTPIEETRLRANPASRTNIANKDAFLPSL